MSEYQYVAFRAIDRAVSKKDLAYMRRQSTRAEITPWFFENEYHYGDFHGNARASNNRKNRMNTGISTSVCRSKRRERWEYGLPQSACRSRLQTTIGGCGKEPWS